MAKVIVTESYLDDIGDAIRSKLGGSDTYKPSEMAGAISQIHGDPVLEALSVTENGTYNPSSGKDGFSQAVVNVPNSYTAGDEGKVVDNGALVAQSSQNITANGTYDTTLKNEAVVNVPNSYSASDEGKVVDNGALVAQTSQNITENGTYDTTLKNEVVVNVSGGGGNIPIISQADWDAMTTAQKQACGLIIIQTASTGFERGLYVNGADYGQKGVHIYTKSTGGNNAAMYVVDGYYNGSQFVETGSPVTVGFKDSAYNCNGVASLVYPTGGPWTTTALNDVTDGTNVFANNDVVKTWTYNTRVDFYVYLV